MQLIIRDLIYRSPQYNDEECNMIKEYASLCSPAFIDAINKLLLE